MSLESCIRAIEAQQGSKRDAAWMCGEQLKDILRKEPEWADMIEEDLKNQEQSLKAIEKKIADKAKKNKVGNCGVVTPMEAEEIIRDTFKIPKKTEAKTEAKAGEAKSGEIISLEDFF